MPRQFFLGVVMVAKGLLDFGKSVWGMALNQQESWCGLIEIKSLKHTVLKALDVQ